MTCFPHPHPFPRSASCSSLHDEDGGEIFDPSVTQLVHALKELTC